MVLWVVPATSTEKQTTVGIHYSRNHVPKQESKIAHSLGLSKIEYTTYLAIRFPTIFFLPHHSVDPVLR